jgi:hypothetical protein
VLLVSRAADRELGSVEVLLRKIGIPVLRVDAETADSAGLVADLASAAVRLHGRWVRPTVTWVRHFSVRAISDRRGGVHQAFLRDSWQAAIEQLAAVSVVTITAQEPGLLSQLALAAASGIRVPRTVVTSDPFLATGLLPGGRIIIKALHSHFVEARPGLLSGVFPDVADLRQLEPARGSRRPPVVVQEFIEHELELRVYYVHGEVIGFAVGKARPADLWVRPEQVTAVQAQVPAAVAAATRSLATAMSIQYGAFDFLISAGQPVFLEVNLAGDWRWIECRTHTTPVTTAVAGMLRDLHLAADARARPAVGGGSPPIDLLTFLGGRPLGFDG